MKGTTQQNPSQNQPGSGQRPRPQQRDELDSRKNEEQDDKGNDTTHNEKQTKEDKLKKK